MRHIVKEISMEMLVSRLPSVMPAFMDGILYFFDENSINGRDMLYPTNYGMSPLNIVLNVDPKDGHDSDEYELVDFTSEESSHCHCYGKSPYDELPNFTLSFKELSNWYHFFIEYYKLLKEYGHCGRMYTSAIDYYNNESGSKYASQMKYGNNIQTYIDLDNEFAAKGGKVVNSDISDNGFFKWMCDNIVPSFTIPNEYKDYWNKSVLYYPEVLKWISWFNTRKPLYKDIEDCKDSSNCCDCEEYKNRGGEEFLKLLDEWNANLQHNIGENINSKIYNPDEKEPLTCFIPTIIIPTTLQTSIYDLGEFSIFSEEYELGVDYRVADGYASANTKGGTVVSVSGESKILSDNKTGSIFDPIYMENLYDEKAFSSYTEVYINEHADDFKVEYNFYTFDRDNKMYVSKAETISDATDDLLNQMKATYQLVKRDNGWVLIDSFLYEINRSEYGRYSGGNAYMNGNIYFVYREEETNTPYTIIGNKKIYASLRNGGNGLEYYFPFFKDEEDPSKEKTYPFLISGITEVIDYVNYNGGYYIIENSNSVNTATVGDYECPIIDGYSQVENDLILYVWRGSNSISPYTYDSYYGMVEYDGAVIDGDNIVQDYQDEIIVYESNLITGRTVSKLLGLANNANKLCDDIGNEIDGIYDIRGNRNIINHQPPQGSDLEPLFQVGNVSNVERYKYTSDSIVNGTNYFVGDIITQMKFYFKTNDGRTAEDISIETSGLTSGLTETVTLPSSGIVSGYTSLNAIHNITNAKNNLSNQYKEMFTDDIYCDILYNIGATLSRYGETVSDTQNGNETIYYIKASGFTLASDDNADYGVEYAETVRFTKERREYYMSNLSKITRKNKNIPSAHSISYPIYVYTLNQEYENVKNTMYDTQYDVPMADFMMSINVFENKKSEKLSLNKDTEVFPVFRDEYRMGVSSIENVKSNIYIERGINAAYERHLKLGEVSTLEALEQFGNGYFKIMDN